MSCIAPASINSSVLSGCLFFQPAIGTPLVVVLQGEVGIWHRCILYWKAAALVESCAVWEQMSGQKAMLADSPMGKIGAGLNPRRVT